MGGHAHMPSGRAMVENLWLGAAESAGWTLAKQVKGRSVACIRTAYPPAPCTGTIRSFALPSGLARQSLLRGDPSFLRVVAIILLFGLVRATCLAASVGDTLSMAQRLHATITDLAMVESRVTGYPGAEAAADYLAEALAAAGVSEVHTQSFPVPVPIDAGFTLQAGAEVHVLHGVWPNLVRTPSLPVSGIEGRLVNGGTDPLTTLDGQVITDRIVLLDYDSGTAWMELCHLGARAVIFLETGRSHRKEAAQKFLGVPAAFPRLYATARVGHRLRALAASNAEVSIHGRMTWSQVRAVNLIGIIEGSDPTLRSEVVLAGAHYDAMSPVPALAPGAEQASSAAALLELARTLQRRPPRRTVVLVLAAGHFQNLAGMRHFIPLLQQAAGRRARVTDLARNRARRPRQE